MVFCQTPLVNNANNVNNVNDANNVNNVNLVNNVFCNIVNIVKSVNNVNNADNLRLSSCQECTASASLKTNILTCFYVFLNVVEYLSAIFILILWGPGAVDRRAGAGRCCWSSGTVVEPWSPQWSKTETHSSGRRQSSKCTSVTKPTSLPRKENSC